MTRLFLIGMILLLTACGTPGISTPAPTPEAINVIYPSALQPWADKLVNCTSDNPQIALYLNQSTTVDTNIGANDIVLELGQTIQDNPAAYLSQVGWEQVVVLVNKDNRLSLLSNDQLQLIFSGQVSKWENGSGQSIQVWVLPEGEPTRTIFDSTVMLTQSLTAEAMLAPSPGTMLEAISRDVNSIGYLPESFLNTGDSTLASKVKIVQLDPSLESELHLPVVALSQSQPKGLLRNLLVCLQGTTP